MILQSIKPKWIEHIVMGNKDAELRKTKPASELPIKVYMYQTKEDWYDDLLRCMGEGKLARKLEKSKGKIIGEYTCNRITKITAKDSIARLYLNARLYLTKEEVQNYLGEDTGYVWEMSDIVIYDDPLEIESFTDRAGEFIKKAPQSWCYVE